MAAGSHIVTVMSGSSESSTYTTGRPRPPLLFEQQPDPFYLEIALRIIRDVCRRPPKYLRYLGWCVLGVEGPLQDAQGRPVNQDGELVNKGVYHYTLPERSYHLHSFVLLKADAPQMSSLTPLTLRSSSYAAQYELKQVPGRVSIGN
jgi:hypothetical protein